LSAVEAAVAMQALMAERNAEVPVNKRMIFRIGVNQGDVVHDDAPHLWRRHQHRGAAAADRRARGVYVSSKVFEEVRDRMKDGFPRPGRAGAEKHRAPGAGVRGGHRHGAQHAPAGIRAGDAAQTVGWSVLQFDNMGGDSEQEYFADGRGRGHHHRAESVPRFRRGRPQFELRLQGPRRRCAPGRA
jgi:adenylate cyclase